MPRNVAVIEHSPAPRPLALPCAETDAISGLLDDHAASPVTSIRVPSPIVAIAVNCEPAPGVRFTEPVTARPVTVGTGVGGGGLGGFGVGVGVGAGVGLGVGPGGVGAGLGVGTSV